MIGHFIWAIALPPKPDVHPQYPHFVEQLLGGGYPVVKRHHRAGRGNLLDDHAVECRVSLQTKMKRLMADHNDVVFETLYFWARMLLRMPQAVT